MGIFALQRYGSTLVAMVLLKVLYNAVHTISQMHDFGLKT